MEIRRESKKMKMVFKETRTVRHEDRKMTLTGAWYTAGRYEIEECVYDYDDGTSWTDYRISHDWAEEYLPDIYYEKRCGEPVGHIEIQTTAYGALKSAEIDKVIAGYREAQEVASLAEKLIQSHAEA